MRSRPGSSGTRSVQWAATCDQGRQRQTVAPPPPFYTRYVLFAPQPSQCSIATAREECGLLSVVRWGWAGGGCGEIEEIWRGFARGRWWSSSWSCARWWRVQMLDRRRRPSRDVSWGAGNRKFCFGQFSTLTFTNSPRKSEQCSSRTKPWKFPLQLPKLSSGAWAVFNNLSTCRDLRVRLSSDVRLVHCLIHHRAPLLPRWGRFNLLAGVNALGRKKGTVQETPNSGTGHPEAIPP